jgi:hypothetical protein
MGLQLESHNRDKAAHSNESQDCHTPRKTQNWRKPVTQSLGSKICLIYPDHDCQTAEAKFDGPSIVSQPEPSAVERG